jgi:hypothetical protein
MFLPATGQGGATGSLFECGFIIDALKNFLKAFCQKRPDLVPGEWMFHWDKHFGHHLPEGPAVPGKKKASSSVLILHPHPTLS